VAALKGFERALELDPTCAASKYQVACTKLLLGLTEDATVQFKGSHSYRLTPPIPSLCLNRLLGCCVRAEILQTKGAYLPAMKGLAQALISLSMSQITQGLIGR
jgi:hypothetical protein